MRAASRLDRPLNLNALNTRIRPGGWSSGGPGGSAVSALDVVDVSHRRSSTRSAGNDEPSPRSRLGRPATKELVVLNSLVGAGVGSACRLLDGFDSGRSFLTTRLNQLR